ncbi:hypothetical protein [Formosa algae]|uniref:Nicotinate-nucleotide adenylyltransferase n=1 Tax=Formosa algae TaxID=225843 RepID=A0A9X0YH54_9FLAO|nr:hypothetical protein [Formosa algae]MBP1838119.1 hypothetical protein [Formosa algae]MDQ0334254.1 hypothetical protein [Formosa algae]OEI80098.1 hypothetical protein AST99_11120 [Formosa algae]
MKKFMSLVCCLFIVNSFYAQSIEPLNNYNSQMALNQGRNVTALSAIEALTPAKTTKATVKTVGVNATYINSSRFTENAMFVKAFQERAAQYNLKDHKVYDSKSKSTYDVVFSNKKGTMTINYNKIGEIKESKEKYKDVALPKPVIISIMKAYPEWRFENNVCNINYKYNKGISTLYKVTISNGKHTKTVKSDDQGNLL